MTYDLFGSWDQHSNWIGPYVYGHTNLTVIKDALNLLWRNGVPANQVNLGLGFYGRYAPGSSPPEIPRDRQPLAGLVSLLDTDIVQDLHTR